MLFIPFEIVKIVLQNVVIGFRAYDFGVAQSNF